MRIYWSWKRVSRKKFLSNSILYKFINGFLYGVWYGYTSIRNMRYKTDKHILKNSFLFKNSSNESLYYCDTFSAVVLMERHFAFLFLFVISIVSSWKSGFLLLFALHITLVTYVLQFYIIYSWIKRH